MFGQYAKVKSGYKDSLIGVINWDLIVELNTIVQDYLQMRNVIEGDAVMYSYLSGPRFL